MLKYYLYTALWSISPLGEAKVGIPFGLFQELNPFLVLLFAVMANILVFPLMMFFLNFLNVFLARWHWYKKSAIWIARRAKKGSQKNLDKYGYVGLAIFVIIPLPGTGVYAGTIAAYLFKMNFKKAFIANAVGITISSLIIWVMTSLSKGLF